MKSSRNSCFDGRCYRHRSSDFWLNGPAIQRRMFLRTQTANRTSLLSIGASRTQLVITTALSRGRSRPANSFNSSGQLVC